MKNLQQAYDHSLSARDDGSCTNKKKELLPPRRLTGRGHILSIFREFKVRWS